MSKKTQELVSSTAVIRAAWQRVQTWYRFDELKPEPEYSSWLLRTEEHLSELSKALASGEYKPAPFKLVPYPKSGAILRHYAVPSVRDQVAFTCYAILLAPLLESRMANFSFGNRWYRGIYMNLEEQSWRFRPYSLFESSLFQPNRRAHNLFRRVTHWTASSMLSKTDVDERSDSNSPEAFEYPTSMLPPFIRKDWWKTKKEDTGYWCQLDLQLAYPSVVISLLNLRLKEMLSTHFERDYENRYATEFIPECRVQGSLWSILDGYPSSLRLPLALHDNIAIELADELCALLQQIEYTSEIKGNFWLPQHTDQTLPVGTLLDTHKGLPTGLLISGLLLNCYLNKLDTTMGEWMISVKDEYPIAFSRYADDLLLISSSESQLFAGLDKVWEGISSQENSKLGLPSINNPSNLRINWSKVQPKGFAEIVHRYLGDHGIKKCECGHFDRIDQVVEHSSTILDWWSSNKDVILEKNPFPLRDATIDTNRLGPFVTFLVERMSEMGGDDSGERFGKDAQDRLTNLHSLIRENRDERQVKADTRLLFAAHRLARSWLPDEGSESSRLEIKKIRSSILEAIMQAPWKFQLWMSVVRAACRRPPNIVEPQDDLEAQAWLENILAVIAYEGSSPKAWLKQWPEDELRKDCRSNAIGEPDAAQEWKRHYLSFLRTYFWRSIAVTLRSLSFVGDRLKVKDPIARSQSVSGWTPESWIFRSLSESQLEPVCNWLSDLDRWYRVLYGDSGEKVLDLNSWELDALGLAYMASLRQGNVVNFLKQVHGTNSFPTLTGVLTVPKIQASGTSLVLSTLEGRQRVSENVDDPGRWNWLRLAAPEEIAVEGIAKLIEESGNDQDTSLCIADGLGALMALSGETISKCGHHLREQNSEEHLYEASPLDLLKYRRMRHVALSLPQLGNPVVQIQQLLWGSPWYSSEPTEWTFSMCHVPPIGLPVRLCLSMFRQILEQIKIDDTSLKSPRPVTWSIDDMSVKTMAVGRRIQFGLEAEADLDQSFVLNVKEEPFQGFNIPHPSYLLPISNGLVDSMSRKYRIWCALLSFLTAIDGSEAILDNFLEYGMGVIPFQERWHLRSRIHLPLEVWAAIDKTRRWFVEDHGWKDHPSSKLNPFFDIDQLEISRVLEELIDETRGLVPDNSFRLREFRWQRTDTSLDLASQMELPQMVSQWEPSLQLKLPRTLMPGKAGLSETLLVRVGQIHAGVDWNHFYQDGLWLLRSESQNAMRQITATFRAEVQSVSHDSKSSNDKPALVVFPEVVLPLNEISSFTQLVQKTGVSGLIGSHIRALPPTQSFNRASPPTNVHLVNDALFVVPLITNARTGTFLPRPFVIRKPNPSHEEFGLAEALSDKFVSYSLLPGTQWYRFVHPGWGDFTVAICSDLLDPTPWRSLQGQLLHLFMCAYNKDVDLFESLTWVRAYENYVNVVSTNHGSMGGSFAWSPQHQYAREIAALRGNKLFLVADVRIPVQDLWTQQVDGLRIQTEACAKKWTGQSVSASKFKAPPPGFLSRRMPERIIKNADTEEINLL